MGIAFLDQANLKQTKHVVKSMVESELVYTYNTPNQKENQLLYLVIHTKGEFVTGDLSQIKPAGGAPKSTGISHEHGQTQSRHGRPTFLFGSDSTKAEQ